MPPLSDADGRHRRRIPDEPACVVDLIKRITTVSIETMKIIDGPTMPQPQD